MSETAQSERNPRRRIPALERQLQLLLDISVLSGAFVAAYLLRFEFSIPANEQHDMLWQLPFVVLLQIAASTQLGIRNIYWRYVGMAELRPFWQSAVLTLAPLAALRLLVPDPYGVWRVPFSIQILSQLLGFGGMLAIRVLRRILWERAADSRAVGDRRTRAVILGAGRSGAAIARELRRGRDTPEVIALLDDDLGKQGLKIHGIPVLGAISELEELVAEHAVEMAIVAYRPDEPAQMSQLVGRAKELRIALKSVPSLEDLLSGRARLRSLQIEDLLGREPVRLDQHEIGALIRDKTVMVTGAGGSIGSEICRQVAAFEPGRLVLVERAEFALFDIDRELAASRPDLAVTATVADITDEQRIRNVLSNVRPDVVLHAAAHKHVPLMESNPSEAIKNNAIGTLTLAEAAHDAEVGTFVLISTDKAVNPSSMMGASKRLAELIVQDLGARSSTRFLAVRFGNVMGSAGSVVPIFSAQIERGGPVTVTHPEMVRFFMTIPEAAQLVLQAAAIGATGQVLVLDMGEPIRVLDLAEDMIRLSGHTPYDDIEIVFSGRRPGEKLAEELESSQETLRPTRHDKIQMCDIVAPPADLSKRLAALGELARMGLEGELRRQLHRMLPRPVPADGPSERNEPADRGATDPSVDFDTPTSAPS